MYFVQNIYYLQKKIYFLAKQKFQAEEKKILPSSIQKMYVLQIKIYIFLNYGIILQKKIFDHKRYTTSCQTL